MDRGPWLPMEDPRSKEEGVPCSNRSLLTCGVELLLHSWSQCDRSFGRSKQAQSEQMCDDIETWLYQFCDISYIAETVLRFPEILLISFSGGVHQQMRQRVSHLGCVGC